MTPVPKARNQHQVVGTQETQLERNLVTPEGALCAAVIKQAAEELLAEPYEPGPPQRWRGIEEPTAEQIRHKQVAEQIYRDERERNRLSAYQFFFGHRRSHFEWMAEGLDLDPAMVQEVLIRRMLEFPLEKVKRWAERHLAIQKWGPK